MIYHTKELSLEEKKLKLVDWIEGIKRKYPERFNKVGWYDMGKVALQEGK